MDLTPTPQEAAFRSELRAWLKENLEDTYRTDALPSEGEMVEVLRRWQRKLAEGRWLAVTWPEEHGGRGLTAIEQAIVDYVDKIKENRLELSDLEGGTFTISNGGVFGSLLSTPILNMPQSGILGMHRVDRRPVAIDEQIVIRPMMYIALSYDHRVLDGKDSVGFLVKVKELLENPERMFTEGQDAAKLLLGI